MLVYIAGAIDLESNHDAKEQAADAVVEAGWIAYAPWGGLRCGDREEYGNCSSLRTFCLQAVQSSDALLVVLTETMSVGTIIEMITAKANRTPVVIWIPTSMAKPMFLFDWDVTYRLDAAIEMLRDSVGVMAR